MSVPVVQTAVVNRSIVPLLAQYGEYREYLRFDFYYSCAYCSISEAEAAGMGFQIDHYTPQNKGGTDDYSNLMWSCQRCNRGKSNVWPSTGEMAAGFRFVRPDQDDPNDHYDVGGYMLFPKTNAGEYTIEVLLLNRAMLKTMRKVREKMQYATKAVAAGLQQMRSLKVDHLRPDVRAKYLEAREDALAQIARLRELEEGELIVRVLNHSPILNNDPQLKNANKSRRDYLKSLGARTDFKFEPTT